VGSSQLTPNAAFSSRAHIPTGRVSLESVIELLIQDFGVVPLSARLARDACHKPEPSSPVAVVELISRLQWLK
jgi:hypothetical protein